MLSILCVRSLSVCCAVNRFSRECDCVEYVHTFSEQHTALINMCAVPSEMNPAISVGQIFSTHPANSGAQTFAAAHSNPGTIILCESVCERRCASTLLTTLLPFSSLLCLTNNNIKNVFITRIRVECVCVCMGVSECA